MADIAERIDNIADQLQLVKEETALASDQVKADINEIRKDISYLVSLFRTIVKVRGVDDDTISGVSKPFQMPQSYFQHIDDADLDHSKRIVRC